MKELFFILLLCTASFAQKKMHLTAYRLIDDISICDGPCSIATYVKIKNVGYESYYATADSDDQELINNLLDIKKKAPRGKSRKFYCEERMYGGETIHQMFVISGSVTDTLFVDSSNKWIIFPEKHKAYLDKDQKFKNALTGIIKEFIEYDFRPAIRAHYYLDERDSIPTGALWYRGRSAVAFIKHFDKDAQGYSLAKTYTSYGNIRKIYTKSNDTITTLNGNTTLIISDPDTGWQLDMIKPGDPVSKLLEHYPASTQVKLVYKVRFEDIKRMYYYMVNLNDEAGSISYYIKDNVVEKIEVYLANNL